MMIPTVTKKKKNLSMARVILAVLRKMEESGKENLFNHKYFEILCAQKSKVTKRSTLSRLQKGGFIKKDFNNVLKLTEKGKRESLFSFIDAESEVFDQDNGKWDGGWRIVFFDIPENKRRYRDYLRKTLKKIGFKEFQKSIWAYPHPVPPFLKELIFDDSIKDSVKFVISSDVYDDYNLRRLFGLPIIKK